MQTIYVNNNKIDFSCKTILFGSGQIDPDCFCFLMIQKNGAITKAEQLTRYEQDKLEERVQELINKGRIE